MVEALNGVNNNRKSAIYTATGAVVGGGAAATYGYLSKPYLKNGIPTDKFCDSFISVAKKGNEQLFNSIKYAYTLIKNIKTKEDLDGLIQAGKGLLLGQIDDNIFEVAKAYAQDAQTKIGKFFLGAESPVRNIINRLAESESADSLRVTVGQVINDLQELIDIDAFKGAIKDFDAHLKLLKKATGAAIWYSSLDNTGKLPSDSVDPIIVLVKKAAKSVQLKTAGIYGAIGAAVIGAGAYVASRFNKE